MNRYDLALNRKVVVIEESEKIPEFWKKPKIAIYTPDPVELSLLEDLRRQIDAVQLDPNFSLVESYEVNWKDIRNTENLLMSNNVS